jgi:hypothetical protein
LDAELKKGASSSNTEKPKQLPKQANEQISRANKQVEPASDDSFNRNEISSGTKKPVGDVPEERRAPKNTEAAKQKAKKAGESGGHLLMWSNVKDFSQAINTMNLKTFTLKQLKDFIEEVYAAKSVYDKKCKDHNLPKETLEQFLYSHLKQKYGLNTMVIEFVYAVIEGIKTYVDKDNDVAVFFHVSLEDPEERN